MKKNFISVNIISLGRDSIYKTLETVCVQELSSDFEVNIILQGSLDMQRLEEIKNGKQINIYNYEQGLGFGYYRNQAIEKSNGNILAGTQMPDSVSGFRAYSRESLYALNVTSQFSYVIDTIIQAHKKGLHIDRVPITTNPPTRPSRLFGNIREHIKKSTANIIRVYTMYEPFKTFVVASLPFFLIGTFGITRFLIFYYQGQGSNKICFIDFILSFFCHQVTNHNCMYSYADFHLKKCHLQKFTIHDLGTW